MFDSIQLILMIVISVLTVLLTVIGIELFKILKELHQSVKKLNEILDDAHTVTNTVAEPLEEASELVKGLKKGVILVKHIGKFLNEEKDLVTAAVKDLAPGHKEKEAKKKFFLKNGKSLKNPS